MNSSGRRIGPPFGGHAAPRATATRLAVVVASVSLADVVATLEAAYPPRLAERWDSVGLVCGDPADTVRSVLVTVDVTAEVVDHAVSIDCDLIVAHHPLLLRGVDTVGVHTPKGALIHRLIRNGCALYTAHTNADSAPVGVSDALARRLGVTPLRPIQDVPAAPLDSWVVRVPVADAEAVREAMFAAGAGRVGDYDRCSWQTSGTGRFRPGSGAHPAIGSIGLDEQVAEDRIELVARRSLRRAVVDALRAAHPYEEPAFDLIEMAPVPSDTGLGRIGDLDTPMTLREFTARVAERLPATATGVRAAGDPDRVIRRVAVCGGAGDSLLDAVRAADVDVYVTSDLRHHPVDEHLRAGGCPVIDVAHWAGEFPWCDQAREILDRRFAAAGDWTCAVADRRTDPWSIAVR